MKKLTILLFLFISVLGYSQQDSIDWDKYKPIVAWKTFVNNVQFLGEDTFSVVVAPIDDDPGTFPLRYGNYLQDKRGLRYEIIDTTIAPTLIVVDIFDANYAPFQGEVGTVYLSANNGESPSLPTGNFEQLEPDALQYGYGLDMTIQYSHGIEYNSPFKRLVLDTTYTETGDEVKGTLYWDDPNRTASLDLGNGVILQIGQETQIPVHNNTGSTIINGRVLFGQAVFNNRITVGLATDTERYTALLIATEDILNNTDGLAVELVGRVNDVNTGGLSLGPIYVDTLGLLTNTKPEFPKYTYPIGAVVKVGVTDGIIQFRSDGVNFYNSIRDAFDGSIRETFDFRTFVEGGVIKGVITNPTGADNLTLVFSSGWFDFAVPDTISLTAGTAGISGVLQDNFIYIDKDTKLLTVNTSGFPENEFAQVAEINLSDETNTDLIAGAYGNQNINNHFKTDDDNGHIVHIADWIRAQNAGWARTGLAATLTVGASSLQWATTGGKMRQFHKQTIPALDMSLGDYMLVKNDPDYPFRPVLNVGYLTKYSDGSTWNNQWTPFVVWLIGNKEDETSLLVLNIPRDGYQTEQGAIDDDNGYADFSIPDNFISKGILIGKFIIRRSGTNYTFNLGTGYQDLRGTVPNNVAGIGGGSSGITDYTQLNQTPATLEALAFQRVDATGVTLENVLAEDILLTDFDSTGFTLEIPQIAGLVDSLNIIRDTTDALRVATDQNASDISGKWNNDGTSTATGDWDIGEFNFSADTVVLSGTIMTTGVSVGTEGFSSVTVRGGATEGFPLIALVDEEVGGVQWNIENGRTVDGRLGFYTAGEKVWFESDGDIHTVGEIFTKGLTSTATGTTTTERVLTFQNSSALDRWGFDYNGATGQLHLLSDQVSDILIFDRNSGLVTVEYGLVAKGLVGIADGSTSAEKVLAFQNSLGEERWSFNYDGTTADLYLSSDQLDHIITLNRATGNATFPGSVTASSLSITNGATVGDVPVLDDDVVRLIDISGKWNNDGTSTATGDWDIGAFDFDAADGNFTNNLGVGLNTGSTLSPHTNLYANYDGDGFPVFTLERSGGTTKTDAKYQTYIGSTGTLVKIKDGDAIYTYNDALHTFTDNGVTIRLNSNQFSGYTPGIEWSDDGAVKSFIKWSGTNYDLHIGGATNNSLKLFTNNIARLTISGAGNATFTGSVSAENIYTSASGSTANEKVLTIRNSSDADRWWYEYDGTNGNLRFRSDQKADILQFNRSNGNATFLGSVTASSLSITNGATVGDAPVLDDDIVRLIDLTGGTEDVDFNSIAVGGVEINPVLFGTDGQMPYTNPTGDGYLYSSNLVFDGTDLTAKGKITIGSGTTPHPIIIQGSTGVIKMPVFVNGVSSESNYGLFWGKASTSLPMWTNTTNTYSFDMTSTSDFWKKKNFKLIDNPLEKILSLNAYHFDWNNDYPDQAPTGSINLELVENNGVWESTGLIAQELEKIIPEVVSEVDDSGYKQVDYDALVPYLIEAIKEQQKQINELKNLIK
jgi:hypothetical protein